MLLKVRLPSSFQPPKLLPHMPNLSMTDVDLTLSALPSSSTILASIIALFVLLSFVRALTIGLREHLAFVKGRKALLAQSQVQHSSTTTAAAAGKATPTSEKDQRPPTTSWLWGLVKSFPPSPSASIIDEKQPQASWSSRVNTHTASRKPGGPAYERPLATLYQSEMPVSMAKMIMSRHTFRRPSSRPPPARSATGIQIQVQRRSPPPPQTPSQAPSQTPSQAAPPTSTPSLSTVGPAPTSTAVIPSTTTPSIPTPTPNPGMSIPMRQATPKPNPRVVIPQPKLKYKSPLYRPVSPPSRSPSPPSPSPPSDTLATTTTPATAVAATTTTPATAVAATATATLPSARRSGGSRSPSPTRSRTPSPTKMVTEERWSVSVSVGGVERRESEIV